MVTTAATSAAPRKSSTARSLPCQSVGSRASAGATATAAIAAGYFEVAAQPSMAPARSVGPQKRGVRAALSAARTAATVKRVAKGSTVTTAPRITSAGSKAAISAANSPAASPARRRASSPVSATMPRLTISTTARAARISSGGSTRSYQTGG